MDLRLRSAMDRFDSCRESQVIGRSAGCRLGSSKPDEKVRLFQWLPIVKRNSWSTCSVSYTGYPDTIDEIVNLAEGKSALNAQTEREGLVWVHGSGSRRISFKTISNKFLARYGD